MLSLKGLKLGLLAFAVAGLSVVPAGEAAADKCKSDRSYQVGSDRYDGRSYRWSLGSWHRDRWDSCRDSSRSRVKASYDNDRLRFSVSFGSDRGHDRDRHRPRYRETSCDRPVVVHRESSRGYWKRVYRSPVYETRYDRCGRPYRVCVREGYYERVWVDSRPCRERDDDD